MKKYFHIKHYTDANLIYEHFKDEILNRDRCEGFLLDFDEEEIEKLNDFYSPDIFCILVEFYDNGVKIWHTSFLDQEVTTIQSFLREKKISRIVDE